MASHTNVAQDSAHDSGGQATPQAANDELAFAELADNVWTDELRDQLAFTRSITSSLSEGVYAVDRAGQFTLANPAAEQLLGWTESELLGNHIHTIIPMRSAQGTQETWKSSLLRTVIRSGTSCQNVGVVMTRRDGTSFLGTYSAAPMIINEQVVGVAVSFRDVTEEQRLQQMQAEYASLMAHEHSVLEQQVQTRTNELAQTNRLLQAEISERKRTEQARQHLLQKLVSAQEEERRRIARELHDQMGQHVTALMLAIRVLQNRVRDASLQQPVANLHMLGNQIGQDVRTLAVQLRPPALDDFGLLPTLTTYIEQWSVQALVAADFYTTGMENMRLPPLVETTVFRVVQEALTNIMRHAQATSVSVIMHRRDDALHVIVEDDGVGFDAEAERKRPYAERRFGLLGIEERVAQLAGSLTIESTLGSGTTVFVSLPLARAT